MNHEFLYFRDWVGQKAVYNRIPDVYLLESRLGQQAIIDMSDIEKLLERVNSYTSKYGLVYHDINEEIIGICYLICSFQIEQKSRDARYGR